MKFALIGYGKMGRAIEEAALHRGHEIVAKIDPQMGSAFQFEIRPDVAIEFSTPESAAENIRKCLDARVAVLSGTTGWLASKPPVDEHCLKTGGTFFYASNFSLGVNIFFRLNEILAGLMAGRQSYNVSIDETHHTQKKDAPSGTAITLAEGIIKKLPSKKKWTNDVTSDGQSIVINSFRVDPVPGTHAIKYHSTNDDIEIKHTAHSRLGFAAGAVSVAEWLPGKKGVLSMADFLQL